MKYNTKTLMPKILVKRIAKLSGHKSAIFTIEKGKEQSCFFSAGGDGMAAHWDVTKPDEGKLIARVPSNIFALKYLEKRNLLALGSLQGILYFIDLENNKVIEPPIKLEKAIYDFEVIEDKLLVAGGSGKLSVVDIERNQLTAQYTLSTENLRSVSFNEALGTIAVGASDNTAYLLNQDFQLTQLLEQHYSSIFTTKLLRNKTLLTGSRDAHLGVWSYNGHWENEHYIPAHNYTINDIVEHPTLSIFATASRDKTIKIWDADTLTLLKVINKQKQDGHLNSVNKLLWLPHNNWLVSASDDHTIMVWEIGIGAV